MRLSGSLKPVTSPVMEMLGNDVAAHHAAERRNRRARPRELGQAGCHGREGGRDVGLLEVEDESGEHAVRPDEVVLVADPVGLPVERRGDRHADPIPLAVEDDFPGEGAGLLVFDRDELEAELVAIRAQLEMQLGEPLIRQPQVLLEVDGGANDAERLARNRHLRGREPEAGGRFDVVALAGGRIVERPRLELRASRAGEEDEAGGQYKPCVQAGSKSCRHKS